MLCKVVPTTEEALTARLLQSTMQALELYGIYLGKELGLYATLEGRSGPLTSSRAGPAGGHPPALRPRVAGAAGGCRVPRHRRSGSGQPTIAASGSHSPSGRHRRSDRRGTGHLAPLAPMVVGIAGVLDQVVEAYRTGGGVPYSALRHPLPPRSGRRQPTRLHVRPREVVAPGRRRSRIRTSRRGRPRGRRRHGPRLVRHRRGKANWPTAEVTGVDTDDASIADAGRRNAEQAGVDVRFASSFGGDEGASTSHCCSKLCTTCRSPVEVLRSLHETLAPGGIVVIADEAVAEQFVAPGDDIERLMYGWSVSHCLPATMAEQPSAALGTVLRPEPFAGARSCCGLLSLRRRRLSTPGSSRIYRLRAH